jgi:hypothetical protein
MPIVGPVWSEPFKLVSPFAAKSKEPAFVGFVREFEKWKQHWDELPRLDPSVIPVKGTLKNRVAATYQEEVDELLILAVQSSVEKSILVLDAGASPNAKGNHSRKRAVLWVAEKRDTALMQVFVDKGAQIEFQASYSPSLLIAAATRTGPGSLEMVKFLVEQGVDIDGPRTFAGRNALGVAVMGNNAPVIEYLVSVGADINLQGGFSLNAAIHNVGCTNRNCDAYLRVPYPTTNPATNVALANTMPVVFESCNPRIVNLLVELGADPTLRCRHQTGCVRGVKEYQQKLMDDRRLAFTMILHERLGACTMARHLDEELVRMVLTDATPRVVP